MIGSANDTSAQRVRLRDEHGLVSDDGMAIEMRRWPVAKHQTGGGPYREAGGGSRPSLFHVVDVVETTVAVMDAPGDRAVRSPLTHSLLQRHSVVVFFEADAIGAAVLTVASRALEIGAAVMVAARAAAIVKASAKWDESRVFVFAVRESGPGKGETAHHVCAVATHGHGQWRVAAFRPAHEWPALRARFGGGAVVGLDIDGTQAFAATRGRVATDLMLARVEAALRHLAHERGATFGRGRGDEFLFATDFARGPSLAEAALETVRGLAITGGSGGTLGAHVGVVPGAPAETVTDRLEAAVADAARATGERVRVHLD